LRPTKEDIVSALAEMIDQVKELFDRFGAERYGEDASQLSHALQCAQLARHDGAADTLIAAALLHDVGQFIDDAGHAAEKLNLDARHEETGAAFLRTWFPEAVTEPVRLHVDAKRYLCSAEAGYAERLSGASLLSLNLQGGPMSPEEAERFLALPYAEGAIRLRRYDDGGKMPDVALPGLASYFPLLERVATGAR
jgi:phosphonate degradation associated HDIG domain protein